MPVWWGRRSQKTKSEDHGVLIFSPNSSNNSSSFPTTPVSSRKRSCDVKTRSFDDQPGVVGAVHLRSPAPGPGCGSRFMGFELDGGGGGAGKECHPLPRPSVSPNSGNGFDHHGGVGSGFGLVNGSVSVSSVSSSGSSDDTPPPPPPSLLDQFPQLGVSRGHDELKICLRSRSPGPGSRVAMTSTSPHPQTIRSSSPLHPQWGSCRVESPTGKVEDGRSQCHPLPLPPSSPTSPSLMYNARTNFVSDNTNISPSRWKRGRLLGRGTFGHVYLGFNSEKGRLCAIKEVKLISDDQNARECLKQLNQEINLLSQLSHPNIVRYYGSELGEETLSVYLEYISGGSIHKLLQEYGPFKEPVIQSYTRQILSGLAYLHAKHTVHRDIKGANILVDPNGGIKLADFGMAKHITNCASALSFKGSPYWMAPEVVMNSNGYSLAVDIWSLGCTILEMATSKPPWSQYEGVAAIFKIGNSRGIPEIPNHLSDNAKSFLRLCLQRDPSLRPSATELLEHPFLLDQSTVRISIPSMTNEAFSLAHDGSNTLKVLDNNIHPQRKSISCYEAEYIRRPVVPVSRELWDNARTITSLPVSPCSSPLRQTGPTYKSCFLSPPHPSYARAGQSSLTPNEPSLSPTRAQSNFPLEPWRGSALYKAQTLL